MPSKKYTVTRKSWLGKKGTEEERTVQKIHISQPCSSDGGVASSVPFVLENVMGQEDIYRTDPITDERTETNTLIGRIVFSTGALSTAVIHYGPTFFGPVNTFEITEPDEYHEAFIPDLNPSTLYVFYVVATPENGDPPLQSELYYFETSDEVNESFDIQIWTQQELLDKIEIEKFLSGELDVYSLIQPPVYTELAIELSSVVNPLVTTEISTSQLATETAIDFV